ncbi:MAG: RDD family protein [bacterium]
MTPADQLQPSLAAPSFFALPPQVAGFWLRGFAFGADIVFLVFLGYMANLLMHDQVLALGKAGNYVGLAAGILYFLLCNGPVGRGRTLGKILLQCRTRAADGQPLTWRGAAVRLLIQFQIVLPSFVEEALIAVLGDTIFARFLASVVGVLSLGLLLATVASVIFDPYRQGFHDWAANSFVQQDLGKGDLPFRLPALNPNQSNRRKLGRRTSWIVFAVVVVVGWSLNYTTFYGTEIGRQRRQAYLDITADLQNNYPLKEFEAPSLWLEKSGPPSAQANAGAAKAEDAITTAGVMIGYYRFGGVDEQALLREIESRDLENQVVLWTQRQLDGPLRHLTEKADSEKKIRFESVTLRYSEVVGLFFYFQQRLVLEKSLPLSPGTGTTDGDQPTKAEGGTDENTSATSSTVTRDESAQ